MGAMQGTESRSPQRQFVATQNVFPIGFIPPQGDLSMLVNEPEIQYKYKNIVDNMQDEPGHTICCKQKREVLDIVEDDPSTSTREIARQVNVSQHKIWETLRENQ
ncbi:hypothetical protein NQ317_002994 [Molorchus minor]|uniref:HTH psq-type domain-containing protein n=1 Tax=Molorchus minor TaxID=1323400 RepID=A0ABQ9JL41_9CUCU|nr:hypothetical protein NQ317_002994 [Molorchus minor]